MQFRSTSFLGVAAALALSASVCSACVIPQSENLYPAAQTADEVITFFDGMKDTVLRMNGGLQDILVNKDIVASTSIVLGAIDSLTLKATKENEKFPQSERFSASNARKVVLSYVAFATDLAAACRIIASPAAITNMDRHAVARKDMIKMKASLQTLNGPFTTNYQNAITDLSSRANNLDDAQRANLNLRNAINAARIAIPESLVTEEPSLMQAIYLKINL